MPEDRKNEADVESSVKGMSRQEFLASVIKNAAIAGTVVAAPKVVDKFLVPPAYAAGSLTTGPPHHPIDRP